MKHIKSTTRTSFAINFLQFRDTCCFWLTQHKRFLHCPSNLFPPSMFSNNHCLCFCLWSVIGCLLWWTLDWSLVGQFTGRAHTTFTQWPWRESQHRYEEEEEEDNILFPSLLFPLTADEVWWAGLRLWRRRPSDVSCVTLQAGASITRSFAHIQPLAPSSARVFLLDDVIPSSIRNIADQRWHIACHKGPKTSHVTAIMPPMAALSPPICNQSHANIHFLYFRCGL